MNRAILFELHTDGFRMHFAFVDFATFHNCKKFTIISLFVMLHFCWFDLELVSLLSLRLIMNT